MLTKRQKEVLDFITTYQKKKDYSPSLEDICKHFKLASVSTAHFHVSKLRDLGYLSKRENLPRAIDVIGHEAMVTVPLLGTIAAGRPIEAIQEKETIAVPTSKIPHSANVYALRVAGNSMVEENINDGDVILVKQQNTAENGQKVVALIANHEVTLKKYYRDQKYIRLQPANSNMEPMIFRNGRDISIQGIFIDVIKTISDGSPKISTKKTSERNTPHEQNISKFINKIIKGDCLKVLGEFPEKSIDMILCDLPYGITQNNWDSLIPLDRLWPLYERIMKDNGVIVLTGQGLFTATLMLSNPKLFKYKITWVKSKPTNFLNAKKQPLRKHEDVCVFYKNQPPYNPQMTYGEPYNKGFRKDQLTGSYGDFKTVEVKSNGSRYPTDVVYFKTAESEGKVYHPTQKPIELGRYLIRTFTQQNAIVLDNACGSGSFLVAAALEGRRYIGIEKNEEVYLHKKHRMDYIKICSERITIATTQSSFSFKFR
jgi:site-specific DNA-methyltransferase (adenine-specific)/modification methylase